jgi:hypothetical protein
VTARGRHHSCWPKAIARGVSADAPTLVNNRASPEAECGGRCAALTFAALYASLSRNSQAEGSGARRGAWAEGEVPRSARTFPTVRLPCFAAKRTVPLKATKHAKACALPIFVASWQSSSGLRPHSTARSAALLRLRLAEQLRWEQTSLRLAPSACLPLRDCKKLTLLADPAHM